MKNFFILILVYVFMPSAHSQTATTFTAGTPISAAAVNSAFATKQDTGLAALTANNLSDLASPATALGNLAASGGNVGPAKATATNGTQSRTLSSRAADRLSVFDISGVVCDGATDISAPINAWTASKPTGSDLYLTVPPCSASFYLASPILPATGSSLHVDLLNGATLAGPGYFYVTREEIWQSNVHVISSIANAYVPSQGQNLSDVTYVQNNTGRGSIGRSFSYHGTPVGPSGGDLAEYHNATWSTGTTGIGMMGLWFVDVAPLNNAADISGGTNWGLEAIEFNPINNGPDTYGWQPNAGVKPAWVGGPWVTPDCWAPDGCFGGSDEWAYAAVSQHSANRRWTSYPAIFSSVSPSNVLTTDAITITTPDGSGTVTFSAGGSLSAVASAIAGAGIADVTASVDSFNRLVIYNSTGNAGKQIALANSHGTPLATLGIAAQTYVNTPHAPTGLPYIPGFYNGFAVLPGATAKSGYGYYAWGDGALPPTSGLQIAGYTAGAYAPAGYGGNWLHGLDFINSVIADNNAVMMQDSQCIAWFANPATASDVRLCDTAGTLTTTSSIQTSGTLGVTGGAGSLSFISPSTGSTIYLNAGTAGTTLALNSNISTLFVNGGGQFGNTVYGTAFSGSGPSQFNSLSVTTNLAVYGTEYINNIQGNGAAITVKGDVNQLTNLGANNSQVALIGPEANQAVQTVSSGASATVSAYIDTIILLSGVTTTFTLTAPAAPINGQVLRLECDVSVTLTVSPNTGQSFKGTPSACSATQGHQWHYRTADTAWRMDY